LRDNHLYQPNTNNNTAMNHPSSTTTTRTTQETTTTGANPYRSSGESSGAYSSSNLAATNNNSGPRTDRGGSNMHDETITRSEEQLRVDKECVESGRAELNRYVTTEHVEQPVAVQKERVVIEREPITEANRADSMRGPALSEAHYETTLKEDRVSAAKETVPIERIRLAKQVETEVQNVGADLRKEHVDFTHAAVTNDMNKLDSNLDNNTVNTNVTAGSAVPRTKMGY